MEANRSNVQVVQTQRDDKGYVYVFGPTEEMDVKVTTRVRRKLWQIFPSIGGSVICVPFGIMLGWPSPTYPILLSSDSPIPISLDQSAMIAGFLMIGNAVGSPFSPSRRFGSKYGIIFSATLMTVGWITMWQARDIYWLLISRFLVGAGNGYGAGQLKIYIQEMTEPTLGTFLIKQINLYVFLGVTIAFAFGPFVDFRQFGIIAVIVAILVLFLAVFLPSTPVELLKNGKLCEARKLVQFLNPLANVNCEIEQIRLKIETPSDDWGWFKLLGDKVLRKNFAIFVLLVFFQQFSGITATVVYSQILFRESRCSYPEFCALLYSGVFFLANIYGIFWATQGNKKVVLLVSSLGVSLILVAQICVVYFEINENFWEFSSLIVMLLFAVVHSIGLGNIPVSLVSELFPKNCTKIISYFFVMFHSILGLLITKIFQVLFTNFSFYAPFCVFLAISLTSIPFIMAFVPKTTRKT